MAPLTIRKLTAADLAAVNEIYNQAIAAGTTGDTTAVSLEKSSQWYAKEDREQFPVFVAVMNDRVVGWLSFTSYRAGREAFKQTAEISYYVHDSFHRKGIGSALLQFAIEHARPSGFKVLLAVILDHNTASIKLLDKHGFAQWGFLPSIGETAGMVRGHFYYGLTL